MEFYSKEIELFVPGRICLFGEHSDWAGVYRRINSKIVPGNVVICGTNQGIYARSKPHASRLIIRSCITEGSDPEYLDIEMNKDRLKEVAESDSIFCYAAGVAYYMMEFYGVGGVAIDNFKTTLPVKKGLSSSAAFCVLVARSFNEIYDLNLTKRAEIEAAYQGEIMTSSRCGRMDQGCAYGQVPVQMIFDGELMTSYPIVPGGDFYLLIGDLKRSKDTVKILADLNRAFPFPQNGGDHRAQEYLGGISSEITDKAIQAIEAGNAEKLGTLMSQAQELFDDHLMSLSDELRSPQLHRVLEDGALKRWVYGGKGVGSQGDGSVQFVARGELERSQLSVYLREEYGVECFNLDLRKATAVKKAIIPVAGNGTRMFPATKAVKKCFLPIVTEEGVSKPILQLIIEEALSGGIEEIGLVINPADEELFNSFFEPLQSTLLNKLPTHLKQEARRLAEIGKHVTLIPQVKQEGCGHSRSQPPNLVGSDTFMLLLGDHLYKSFQSSSCARQVVDCFNELGAKNSVVGIYKEKLNHLEHYGTVSGSWEEEGVLALSAIKEKPTADYAAEFLTVERNNVEEFFCVNGIYVLTPLLFSILSDNERGREGDGAELELTAALEQLIGMENCYGCEVDGEHFDTGLPTMFVNTVSQFALK